MITHREIRTAMKARMDSISNIGRVHEYERWSKRTDTMRDLYAWEQDSDAVQNHVDGADQDDDHSHAGGRNDHGEQIRGWFIRRPGNVDLWGATTCITRNEDWEIRGFMSLRDGEASELDFDDLVEAVMYAFFDEGNVLPGVRLVSNDSGAEVRLIQAIPVMFAGVLCHSAVIGLRVEVVK